MYICLAGLPHRPKCIVFVFAFIARNVSFFCLATHAFVPHSSASETVRRNPFIETALSYALTYISSHRSSVIDPASVTILADNDYYSKPGEARPATASSPSSARFLNFNVPLWDAHKTGLGSSAALVTAFTAALLVHYLPENVFSLATDVGRRQLHNLAQAAHCAAQGKVGSGFDVASAVYGSCLYKRFSPSLLQSHGEPGTPNFLKKLQALVEESESEARWDTEIVKSAVKIPRGLRLVLCDVDCGSQTPGMVKTVLAWRKENPQVANRIWDDLQQKNDALANELVRLADASISDFSTLRDRISSTRELIRTMSEQSGVPIEPQEQTDLLDELSAIPGVVGGVVPGAGGYDAVSLLIEDKEEVITQLDKFLHERNQKSGAVMDVNSKIGRTSMLGVREEMEGVRIENMANYGSWIS